MSSVHRNIIRIEGRAYRAVLAQGSRNWSGHMPDLPGLVATGATRDEVKRRLIEAAAFHLKGLQGRAGKGALPEFAAPTTATTSPERPA